MLKAALTPNNIKARFRSTGIWPLDHTAVIQRMEAAATGFEPDFDVAGGSQTSRKVTGVELRGGCFGKSRGV